MWTLATGSDGSLQVDLNGSAAGYSDHVVQLAYVGHVVSQENASSAWWSWTGGAWVSESDPTIACHDGGVVPGHDGGAPTGNFRVVSGQIVDPSGSVWVGRGINLYDNQLASASDASGNPLLALFPKLGIVRVPCYSYAQDTPAYLKAFVDTMTSRGIVVELEDHTNSDGSNAGGSSGTVFTGTELSDELAWYASLATAFAGNPYVWFGTDNEPSEDPSAAALSSWQQQTYQAIRSAGNASIVMVEMNCDTSGCGAGYTASVYGAMTNIAWDVHDYGWLTNYSTNQTTDDQTLAALVKSAQGITSADGTVPIVIGEYGNSTTGATVDANGSQTVQAVGSSGYPSMAWEWSSGSSGDTDTLTLGNQLTSPYGQQVAAIVAQ